MKTIITNLEKQLEKLRNLIKEREDKVESMSEKWQESEKCEDFMFDTQTIEDQANELENIIDKLKEI